MIDRKPIIERRPSGRHFVASRRHARRAVLLLMTRSGSVTAQRPAGRGFAFARRQLAMPGQLPEYPTSKFGLFLPDKGP
jgi:hypothetical protein